MMNDLRFAQGLARSLEAKERGAGAKFLRAAIEAIDIVLQHLSRLGSRSYQAEFLFNDYARKKELLNNLLVDFSERFGDTQGSATNGGKFSITKIRALFQVG